MNISIKNKRNFIFESNSLLKAFKEMINQQNSPDANQEVPKFDDFIKINENSNQEKFFKGIFIFF